MKTEDLSANDSLVPWIMLCSENDSGDSGLSGGKHEFQFDAKNVWDLNGLFGAFAEKFQFRVFSRNWDALFDWLTDLSYLSFKIQFLVRRFKNLLFLAFNRFAHATY